MGEKYVISDEAPKDLTVEKVGDFITLQLHLNVLRMGPQTSACLLSMLKELLVSPSGPKQELHKDGKLVLWAFREGAYWFIRGNVAKFNLREPHARRLIDWLEANVTL